jgi:hypothetical protein
MSDLINTSYPHNMASAAKAIGELSGTENDNVEEWLKTVEVMCKLDKLLNLIQLNGDFRVKRTGKNLGNDTTVCKHKHPMDKLKKRIITRSLYQKKRQRCYQDLSQRYS